MANKASIYFQFTIVRSINTAQQQQRAEETETEDETRFLETETNYLMMILNTDPVYFTKPATMFNQTRWHFPLPDLILSSIIWELFDQNNKTLYCST